MDDPLFITKLLGQFLICILAVATLPLVVFLAADLMFGLNEDIKREESEIIRHGGVPIGVFDEYNSGGFKEVTETIMRNVAKFPSNPNALGPDKIFYNTYEMDGEQE